MRSRGELRQRRNPPVGHRQRGRRLPHAGRARRQESTTRTPWRSNKRDLDVSRALPGVADGDVDQPDADGRARVVQQLRRRPQAGPAGHRYRPTSPRAASSIHARPASASRGRDFKDDEVVDFDAELDSPNASSPTPSSSPRPLPTSSIRGSSDVGKASTRHRRRAPGDARDRRRRAPPVHAGANGTQAASTRRSSRWGPTRRTRGSRCERSRVKPTA